MAGFDLESRSPARREACLFRHTTFRTPRLTRDTSRSLFFSIIRHEGRGGRERLAEARILVGGGNLCAWRSGLRDVGGSKRRLMIMRLFLYKWTTGRAEARGSLFGGRSCSETVCTWDLRPSQFEKKQDDANHKRGEGDYVDDQSHNRRAALRAIRTFEIIYARACGLSGD